MQFSPWSGLRWLEMGDEVIQMSYNVKTVSVFLITYVWENMSGFQVYKMLLEAIVKFLIKWITFIFFDPQGGGGER